VRLLSTGSLAASASGNKVEFTNTLFPVKETLHLDFTGTMKMIFGIASRSACLKVLEPFSLFIAAWMCAPGSIKNTVSKSLLSSSYGGAFVPSPHCALHHNYHNSVCFCLYRFYPYLRRHFEGKEWDDRKPRLPIRISKWSQLYLGDRCRGGEQDSYSFSIFRCGGGIRLFIFVRRASAPGELQDEVSKQQRRRGDVQLEECVRKPAGSDRREAPRALLREGASLRSFSKEHLQGASLRSTFKEHL